jgi:hypothetical protein
MSCNLNGFQIAKTFEAWGGPNILSISLYSIFIFSCIGLILMFALLMKKKFSIGYDWADLIIIITAFLIFMYGQIQSSDDPLIAIFSRLQSGAYIIFIGLTGSLFTLLSVPFKTKKTSSVHDTKQSKITNNYIEREYNSEGKLIKSSYYKNGKLYSYWEDEYDSEGNQTKSSSYNENGKLSSYTEYEYDTKGNLTKSSSYNENDKLSSYNKYEYDSQEKEVKGCSYNANGELTSYYELEYEYDSPKNMKKISVYNTNGDLYGYSEYKYDSQGKQIKQNEYNANREFYSYYELEYDSQGKLTKLSRYNTKGVLTENTIYTYKETPKGEKPKK